MASCRNKVLIISTDPAHNLSDAFDQKLSPEPTLIKGFNNLYALELDPNKEQNDMKKLTDLLGNLSLEKKEGLVESMKGSFPGIDEAMNLKYIAGLIDSDYDVVIFDTAPTGHTLRLLNMPEVLGKSLEKLLQIKTQFASTIEGLSAFMSGEIENNFNNLFNRLQEVGQNLSKVATMFKNPEKTTFIAVCIPEFLPVFETERLINELMTHEIDIRNIIVNHVLMQEGTNCRMCKSRMKVQEKYLKQIREMFEDFHITYVPLQKSEIRGIDKIRNFSSFLINNQ
ncbi:MAG: arsenical pump-driving ATPase GET3 [archaeon]|nr:arsenical pump-driving ATPase GET3 [archaeon]